MNQNTDILYSFWLKNSNSTCIGLHGTLCASWGRLLIAQLETGETHMSTTFKLSALALALTASSLVSAQTKAPEPELTMSYNIGATTDYRYRGISQSRLKPALQGGLDLTTKSGFYAGAWGSTIQWVKDAGGKSNTELDFYAGVKGELMKDVGFDVGFLSYVYSSNNLSPSANTNEMYAALTYGPVTVKYSHALTNLFGFVDSDGSGYLDITANFDLGGGWSVAPHIGRQTVRNNRAFGYTDYSIGVTKDLGGGFSASASVIGTNSKVYVSPALKNLGASGLVLGAKYSF
jgi:uncharacterized protein (TIGR02001 family)